MLDDARPGSGTSSRASKVCGSRSVSREYPSSFASDEEVTAGVVDPRT